MIDMGQYATAQERREAVAARNWPDPEERRLRNVAISSDREEDWIKYHIVRAARLAGESA